ncbi:MAG: DUF192 domain-containing protein [Alphaproteobacteria bacterium]
MHSLYRYVLVGLGVLLFAATAVATAVTTAAAMGDRAAGNALDGYSRLTIQRGDITIATYQVEVAATEGQRAQGLMFRQKLPADQGMLFIYEQPRPVRMWMKNTYIPLDMLFADDSGLITHIHRGAKPYDLTPIAGGAAVRYVLEIRAGHASARGLRVGDYLIHKNINKQ